MEKLIKESCTKLKDSNIRDLGQNSGVYHFPLSSLLVNMWTACFSCGIPRPVMGNCLAMDLLKRCRWDRDTRSVGLKLSQTLLLPLASCPRAPPSSVMQTAGRGKAPSKCAKTGWLWLKWFPLASLTVCSCLISISGSSLHMSRHQSSAAPGWVCHSTGHVPVKK